MSATHLGKIDAQDITINVQRSPKGSLKFEFNNSQASRIESVVGPYLDCLSKLSDQEIQRKLSKREIFVGLKKTVQLFQLTVNEETKEKEATVSNSSMVSVSQFSPRTFYIKAREKYLADQS